MEWTIANILTLSRLILVPVFLVFFLFKFYAVAFFVFVIASFTDLIDGTVARFFKQHSRFGAILDPIADKLLMITAYSCLVYIGMLPGWFLFILVGREVVIMSGIGALKLLKIDFEYKPFWSSKLATLALMLLGTLSLASVWDAKFQFWAYPVTDFVEGLMYITSILLILTGLQYVQKGLEILQKNKQW